LAQCRIIEIETFQKVSKGNVKVPQEAKVKEGKTFVSIKLLI
jgi:hypothetical protein